MNFFVISWEQVIVHWKYNVVRAFAHEQFARLVLNYDEKLDLTSESLPVESKVTGNKPYEDGQSFQDLVSEASVKLTLEENLPASRELIAAGVKVLSRNPGQAAPMCKVSLTPVHTVADPISSKLAAAHHVSQAISSLRRMRQLQSTELELEDVIETNDKLPSSIYISVCACGDADCIEVCNIREWLPTSKLDHKLWKLVLLLGEFYLALGQAYEEDGQLNQALKVAELACSIYGSIPQHLEDTRFISSMISCSSLQKKFIERNECTRTYSVGEKDDISNSADDSQTFEPSSSTYLFWAKAWTLVGDVYVELHTINGKEISIQARRKSSNRQLRMSSEVAMEVERLKKKLGQHNQNCSSCSLVNCSFQRDRASSESSVQHDDADVAQVPHGRYGVVLVECYKEAAKPEGLISVTFVEEESLEFVSSMSESDVHEKVSSSASGQNFQDLAPEGSVKENLSASQELIAAGDEELRDPGGAASSSSGNESSVSPASVQTVADPISSILAEVHHLCQHIKSYILGRQLQSTKQELQGGSGTTEKLPNSSTNSSVCACGGADCIEARNIQEWLQTSKWDNVLQKLVLTLGVTCLGLGHAYKDNGESLQALKVIESACYICGSTPQHLEDTKFISPMVSESNEKTIPYSVGAKDDKSSSADDSLTVGQSNSTEIFWSTAWMLVGDVYIEFKNYSSCSMEDCTCLSDRPSSGSSTSTSGLPNAKICSEACERKISHAKGSPYSLLGDPEDDSVHHQMHGIFKYLRGPFIKNEVYNYSDALSCYGEARKALVGLPSDSAKLQLLVNKEKWVRDALEEIRLSSEALSQSINWLLQQNL
ncbi:hypothetical protein CFP56_042273 [Quercus suber]|uniref:Uncharacterized protein n=1 Tax=Quercus suber TaxID=58331 RepID=A0AAW0LLM3_QUESU